MVARQVPLSMGFSKQKCWSELPFPPLGDLPNLGIKLWSPALQADSLLSEPYGKANCCNRCIVITQYCNCIKHLYLVSLMAQMVKKLPAMQEIQVQSLGWEDPLEKGMATHSSILAWRIA